MADVQNKLVAKDNEIQSLHSKLTDTMVSKQQLEQRMMQLMDAEQKRATAEDSIQRQLQVWLYLTHSMRLPVSWVFLYYIRVVELLSALQADSLCFHG